MAVAPVRVRDVPGGLLEVRAETAPLDRLGKRLRHLLARKVDARELRNGVIAVGREHPAEEVGGAGSARLRGHRSRLLAGEEFVEQQTTQALRAPAVASEQRRRRDLREVDETEDRAVKIGDVRA